MPLFQKNASPVEVKILLPDKQIVALTIRKSSTADEVYAKLIEKINLSKSSSEYFYLFEISEYNFGTLQYEYFVIKPIFTTLLLGHSRSTHRFDMSFWYQWCYLLVRCMQDITPEGSDVRVVGTNTRRNWTVYTFEITKNTLKIILLAVLSHLRILYQ